MIATGLLVEATVFWRGKSFCWNGISNDLAQIINLFKKKERKKDKKAKETKYSGSGKG